MTNSLARAALAAASLGAAALLGPVTAQAQAWSYPSFQPPTIAEREFNFAVADAGGTSLIFQWREGIAPRSQFGLDVGYSDPDGRNSDGVFIIGGSYSYQMIRARQDLPLDFLLTTGLGIGITDGGNLLRVPVGVSVGHTFELDQGLALTPYAHPRLSIDHCNDCGGPPDDDSRTELGVDFDLGVDFRVNPSLSLRFSALLGGSELFGNKDGIGLSLAWRPLGLRR